MRTIREVWEKKMAEKSDRTCRRHGMIPLDNAMAMVREYEGALLAKIHYPYRQSSSVWAGGGGHHTTWEFGVSAATCSSSTAWSGNGKWSGTNSHARLTVSPRAWQLLGGKIVIGGLVSIDAEPTEIPHILRLTWLQQSRGVSVKTVRGFLVHRKYHSMAATPARAWSDYRRAVNYGNLWEPCERCGREPVCAQCMVCDRHCVCGGKKPTVIAAKLPAADYVIRRGMGQGFTEAE